MRNLSRHAGPNRMMFLLLIPCLLLSALRAKAEETALPEGKRPGVTLQVEMDLVSSYIWRGVYEAGPSLQPGLTLGIGNFTIAAWGSVDFTSSSYKEADLMLSYRLKNITFHLKDLYDEGSASTGIRRSAATTSISAPTPRTASKPASNGRYRAKSPSRSPGTRSFSEREMSIPGGGGATPHTSK